jgi:iron(II)-dependent oxidoreductase
MKTIRGGAFDTYFDSQACCSFQSGDDPLARKHNIGFRCAISLCDLADESGELADAADREAMNHREAARNNSDAHDLAASAEHEEACA